MMEITVFRGQNIDVAITATVMQPSVWDLWWKIAIYHDNDQNSENKYKYSIERLDLN